MSDYDTTSLLIIELVQPTIEIVQPTIELEQPAIKLVA